jgi:hypothetical protein
MWEGVSDSEKRRALRRTAGSVVVLAVVASSFLTVRAVASDAGVRTACQMEANKEELLGRVVLVADEPVALNASTLGVPAEYFRTVSVGEDPPASPEVSYAREVSPGGPWEYGGLRILTAAADRYWVFAAAATPRRGIVGVDASLFEAVRVAVDTLDEGDRVQPVFGICRQLL